MPDLTVTEDRAARAADSILAGVPFPPDLDATARGLVRSAVMLGWVHGHSAGMKDAADAFAEVLARATP